jgi:hypothetical protein
LLASSTHQNYRHCSNKCMVASITVM